MPKKSVESDDPVLGQIIRTWVERRHACGVWRRSGEEASGKRAGKKRGRWRSSPRTHPWSRFGRRRTEEADRREGVELGRRSHGGRRWRADSGGESSSEAWGGAGEVEDKVRKVLVEGIDERRPE